MKTLTLIASLVILLASCETLPKFPETTTGEPPQGLPGVVPATAGYRSLSLPEPQVLPAKRTGRENRELLRISDKSLNLIIHYEVGGEAHFRSNLRYTTYPGGASGVTIGVGYDLGYKTTEQVESDWGGKLPQKHVDLLKSVVGIRGQRAHEAAARLRAQGVEVSWGDAKDVFVKRTLPRFAAKVRQMYPGVEELEPDAVGGILSCVFNRGESKDPNSDRRREMLAIERLIQIGDLKGIARQLRSMKRIWINSGLPGLLKRRDSEAGLVENADRDYASKEIIPIYPLDSSRRTNQRSE